MELFRLHYFLELCKVKQFTKAAENLAISQAALSKQIKNAACDQFHGRINKQYDITATSKKGMRAFIY